MINDQRLQRIFFERDVLEVASDLLGKVVVKAGNETTRYMITEVEAYRGEEDLACHARVGKTSRTKVMYGAAGHLYVYLIYGMYWMLNIVTGKIGEPQAVLIRGVQGISGPGRVGRRLLLDKTFYGEDMCTSNRLWFEAGSLTLDAKFIQTPRIGVEYAGEWAQKPWRWKLLSGKLDSEKD